MRTFPAARSSDLSSLPGAVFFIPRTQLIFPNELFFCRAKYAESGSARLHNLTFASANPLVAEKEEAKAISLCAENLSIPSLKEEPAQPVPAPITPLNSKKLKALARLTDDGLTGKPPPHIIYLTELGMEIEAIKSVVQKYPYFAYYSLDRNIKPYVEFLRDLGVPESDIPAIISRKPELCGIRLSEDLPANMTSLKNLGLDNEQLIKGICRCPWLLTLSRQKLDSGIDLLFELGLPAENLGKVLTRGPQIFCLNVETLKARAEYFHSIGVDVGSLFSKHPTIFTCDIETHYKPLTEFFLERGFSTADMTSMISRFGALYTFSLSNNIIPKWEFFLTMCYSKSDLVKYPQYFGHSLEHRIKPRYATMRESGVRLSLTRLLRLLDGDFHKALKPKKEKHVG